MKRYLQVLYTEGDHFVRYSVTNYEHLSTFNSCKQRHEYRTTLVPLGFPASAKYQSPRDPSNNDWIIQHNKTVVGSACMIISQISTN